MPGTTLEGTESRPDPGRESDNRSLSTQEENILDTFPLTSLADIEKNDTTTRYGQSIADELVVNDPPEPLMEDPGWSDFVMSHFLPNELDPQGCPKVHGLRRVARKLLGVVLYSGATVVKPTEFIHGLENVGKLNPVTVSYKLTLLVTREAPASGYEVTFEDVADAYFANTDEDYLRHAVATCATKAESRCYRKALMLNKVSADELTRVPTADAAMDGLITPTQINFINLLCARNNINVKKYLQMGKDKSKSIEHIPFGTAANMVKYLSDLQNTGNIPDSIRGYEADWNRD